MVQVSETEDEPEPTMFLGNEKVVALKASLAVRLRNGLHSTFCKQTLFFRTEDMCIMILYQSLNNTSKTRDFQVNWSE